MSETETASYFDIHKACPRSQPVPFDVIVSNFFSMRSLCLSEGMCGDSGHHGLDLDDSSTILLLFIASLFGAIVFYRLRLLTREYVWRRIYSYFTSGKKHSKKVATVKMQKFSYQAWLACYYSFSAILGYYVVSSHPWGDAFWSPWETDHLFKIWENHPQIETHQHGLIVFYYVMSIAFYFAELFAVLTESRRSDFWEYVLHHVVTVCLLVFSYAAYEHRIGVVILLIHDVSDHFLCMAKCFHYLSSEIIVNTYFAAFLGSFVWLRLYVYPGMWVSGFRVAPVVLKYNTARYGLIYGLVVLQCLHFYWFALVLKMVKRLVWDGVKGDVRSDEE